MSELISIENFIHTSPTISYNERTKSFQSISNSIDRVGQNIRHGLIENGEDIASATIRASNIQASATRKYLRRK